jgi:hypothetical protein
MYYNLVLPTGSRVGIFSSRLQKLVIRSNAFVIFYAVLLPGFREAKPLSFSTIVTLFMDLANSLQWAGIVRYWKVQVVSNLLRPRRFDEEVNRIIWVLVDCIIDLVGVA